MGRELNFIEFKKYAVKSQQIKAPIMNQVVRNVQEL